MKEKWLKLWEKHRTSLLLIVVAVILASCVELGYNISVFRESRKSGTKETYDVSDLKTKGMSVEGESLAVNSKKGKIYLYPEGKYVDKLGYSYQKEDEDELFDVSIEIITYDAYGNETKEKIQDTNPYILDRSIVNIRKKVKEICIVLPENGKGVKISGIYIQNKPQFVGMRWLFFWALFSVILLFWKNRKKFEGKPEKIFLLIGLTGGTMMTLIMPFNKVGCDEEVHFKNAYDIKLSSAVSTTDAIEQLKFVTLSNWPYNINQSREEREAMKDYYLTEGDYKGSQSQKVPTNISFVGAYHYIFMSLGIKLGKLLHLPFTTVYMMGRLFNMWTYLVLIYFAIKRLPIGKYIMAVMALMPAPMFQAGVYSYDTIVTGFMYLGMAYLIAELIEKDQKITIKNGLILLGSLGFGMVPKAVYVPMMALGFLIPKEKFVNEKQRKVFRSANIVCILGLLATFALPMLFATNSLGDTRGGEVNVSGQISLILSHPFGYLQVWLENVARTFWSYTFGQDAWGSLGHLPYSTCVPMIGLLLVFTIATDNLVTGGTAHGTAADQIGAGEADLTVKQKWILGIASGLSVAFVWGALYLSFNEVGRTLILGVQGRYFIPLLFPFYMLLRRRQIKNTINPVVYQSVLFGGAGYILFKTIYDCILAPCCF
ncbi:MAG: DUF2142 domain-containing protein [Lachnospiraceae bacterium]|nr:DUF2142 domain-containing protein [Lachnospiraceae bacterium]